MTLNPTLDALGIGRVLKGGNLHAISYKIARFLGVRVVFIRLFYQSYMTKIYLF